MKGERALPVPSLLILSQRNHPNEIEFRRCIYGGDTTQHLIFYFGEVLELGTGDSPLPAARGGKRGGVGGRLLILRLLLSSNRVVSREGRKTIPTEYSRAFSLTGCFGFPPLYLFPRRTG